MAISIISLKKYLLLPDSLEYCQSSDLLILLANSFWVKFVFCLINLSTSLALSSSTAFYLGNMLKNNISVYYYRNSSNTIWGESELNLINLNNIFLNYIGEQFANKIAIHPWVVRGNDYLINSIAKNIVQLEVINPGLNTIFEGKIGLMYVSDYAYAADSNYWNLTVSRYTDITGDNWMYMGLFEWTITDYYSSSSIYFLSDQGRVSSGSSSAYAVRPVFYLNSDVIYVSGTGTQTDPYQIQ